MCFGLLDSYGRYMKKKVMFLRRKPLGENSIEELAYTLNRSIKGLELVVLPEYSDSIKHIIDNIKFARKYQGDINHIFSPTEAYLVVFLKGKKIITWHDLKTALLSNSVFKGFLRKLFYVVIPSVFVHKLTCISQFTANELLAVFPYVKSKIKVIHNPYNSNIIYFPKAFNRDNPLILHIGTAERKNLLRVLEAIIGIKCKIVIVGRLNETQRSFLESHSEIQYEHYQDVSFDQIIKFYRSCDLVSFPSLYEGFGMPILEANVVGRAVFTSKCAAIPEIAGDSVHYVDPVDVNDIHLGINKLIQDSNYRENLILKGLANAQKYDCSRIIAEYIELYARLSKR